MYLRDFIPQNVWKNTFFVFSSKALRQDRDFWVYAMLPALTPD